MGRAVVFHGPGHPFELISMAKPPLREGEMLVRVLACTLCRSDLHSHAGRRTVATPTILGHEIVGRIEAFGPSTAHTDMAGQPATLGDRITWSILVNCGQCFYCTHDLPQKCQQLFKYGHEPMTAECGLGGGLADFIVLMPGTAWRKLPNELSDSVAALSNCAAATAAAVLRYAGCSTGQRVLIMGGGVLGAIVCAMASAAAARQVLVVDPHPACRDRATAFGATRAFDAADEELTHAVMEATDGIGADVVFEVAGTTASVETGLSLVRTGGTMVLAGTVATCKPVSVDPEDMVRRMITLRGVHNYHPRDLQAAVAFLAGPGAQFPLASLIAEKYPLEHTEEAFRRAHAAPGVRVIVVPQ